LKKELADEGGPNGVDEELLKVAEDFKKQAEAIVEEKCRLLDEVDKVCWCAIIDRRILTHRSRSSRLRSRTRH
jgi:hypothetical protein